MEGKPVRTDSQPEKKQLDLYREIITDKGGHLEKSWETYHIKESQRYQKPKEVIICERNMYFFLTK